MTFPPKPRTPMHASYNAALDRLRENKARITALQQRLEAAEELLRAFLDLQNWEQHIKLADRARAFLSRKGAK